MGQIGLPRRQRHRFCTSTQLCLVCLWAFCPWGGTSDTLGVSAANTTLCNSVDSSLRSLLHAASASPATADPSGSSTNIPEQSAETYTFVPGCNTFTDNYVCEPWNTSLTLQGNGLDHAWDVRYSLFQFSIEAGVTVTLRNMTLANTLVFTVGYTNLQPAMFHMREGSSLELISLRITTLCPTVKYYQSAYLGPDVIMLSPTAVYIHHMNVSGVVAYDVTLACDPAAGVLPGPASLVVHHAQMLATFLSAQSALSLQATVMLAENITLPRLDTLYNPEKPTNQIGVVTSDTTITGSKFAPVTYIDANHTRGWIYVVPPARLTFENVVLTRLYTREWSPGVADGVLAGAVPLFAAQVAAPLGSPQQQQTTPQRLVSNSTMVIPQYEVQQMSYWCVVASLLAPDVSRVADFLRSLVWQSECEVLSPTAVQFRRVRTTQIAYTNVLLTSVAPPGVPSDPADVPPPEDALHFPHVRPPVAIVSNARQFVEAVAPIVGSTAAPPPPYADPAGNATANSSSSGAGVTTQLPVLVLINGTVSLTRELLGIGTEVRAMPRSVIVTCARRPGGWGSLCPDAVIDLGQVRGGIPMLGNATKIVYEGVTLRNLSDSITLSMVMAAEANQTFGPFTYPRSTDDPRIIGESITLQLTLRQFAAVQAALTSKPHRLGPSLLGIDVYKMDDTNIQLISVQSLGFRGAWVNLTLAPEEVSLLKQASTMPPPGPGTPWVEPEGDGDSDDLNVGAIVGAAVGGSAALVLALVGALYVRRRQARRRQAHEQKGADGAGAADAAGAGGSPDSGGDVEGGTPQLPVSANAEQCSATNTGLTMTGDLSGSGSSATEKGSGSQRLCSLATGGRMASGSAAGAAGDGLAPAGASVYPGHIVVSMNAAHGGGPMSPSSRSLATTGSAEICATAATLAHLPSTQQNNTALSSARSGSPQGQDSRFVEILPYEDGFAMRPPARLPTGGSKVQLHLPAVMATEAGPTSMDALSRPPSSSQDSHLRQLSPQCSIRRAAVTRAGHGSEGQAAAAAASGFSGLAKGRSLQSDTGPLGLLGLGGSDSRFGSLANVAGPGSVSSTQHGMVPEALGEVHRLVAELASGAGRDQLMMLEPIGQGGHGMVYRGIWRNLDVAVKTILFQDRAYAQSLAGVADFRSLPPSAPPSFDDAQHNQQRNQQQHQLQQPGAAGGASAAHVASAPLSLPHCFGKFPQAPGAISTSSYGGGDAPRVLATAFPSLQMHHLGGAPQYRSSPNPAASQQRAVLEAAVSSSVAHPNVVATYHYDITPVRPEAACAGGMMVSEMHAPGSLHPGLADNGGSGSAATPSLAPVSDWKLYLVQEFCDAGSLAAALDARALHDAAGKPNLAFVLCVLADVARGMAHIHSRNIVHGDLTPTNILLKRRTNLGPTGRQPKPAPAAAAAAAGFGSGSARALGNSGMSTPTSPHHSAHSLSQELHVPFTAKIADFGLCGVLDAGKRHISNTRGGTPFYTAPEIHSTGMLTKAADVYSFGVVMWEVFTGTPPFLVDHVQGFVRNAAFPGLPLGTPPTFAAATAACLNPMPELRPTFDQVLEQLTALQLKMSIQLQQHFSRLMAAAAAGSSSSGGCANSNSGPLPAHHSEQQPYATAPAVFTVHAPAQALGPVAEGASSGSNTVLTPPQQAVLALAEPQPQPQFLQPPRRSLEAQAAPFFGFRAAPGPGLQPPQSAGGRGGGAL